MDPHGRPANSSRTASWSTKSASGHAAARHAPATSIDVHTPLNARGSADSSTTDSPGLVSLKSVDSVPVTGVYPLGSLHVVSNDTKDDDDDEGDVEDMDSTTTPLTVPDRTPEPAEKETPPALLQGGDVLILDDLPANFTVGFDAISFSTTQPFLGFRDIPPGAHLIWVSPLESTSTRSGYWISTPDRDQQQQQNRLGGGKVYVKQWDRFNELLSDPASQAEDRFQRERLGQIFPKLAPYQFEASASTPALSAGAGAGAVTGGAAAHADPLPSFLSDGSTIWQHITSAITPQLLDRLLVSSDSGSGGKSQPRQQQQEAWAVHTSDRIVGETSMPEEARLYPTSAAQLRFSFPMDQRLFDPAAEGSERTQQALDPTSWVLKHAASSLNSSGDDKQDDDGQDGTKTETENVLLGEVQFAFLTGMHLGNYSCLEQWWYYATLIVFRSYRLATERPVLARRLIEAIHGQLVYDEQHLDHDGGSSGGGGGGRILDSMPDHAQRLRRALTVYKSRLDEQLLALGERCTPSQNAAGAAFAALESWLWRCGWDLRGDYVRSGKVMLEDGEIVDAELSDFESEDERGEFAAVVVDVDENGRPTDFVSV